MKGRVYMTYTTELTSIRKVKTVVNEILKNATDFDTLLDDLDALDSKVNYDFAILLMTGDDMGEGFDDEHWYIHIYNVLTDKQMNFDVTDIINKLD